MKPADDDADYRVPTGSDSRFALHNWRVPTRLVAIAIVPVVAGLIFAGLRVSSSIDFARQADEAERVANLTRSATTLAHALQNERDVSALPLTRGNRKAPEVQQARANTDRALAQFRKDAAEIEDNDRVLARVRAAEVNLSWLKSLRKNAFDPALMPLATQLAYSEMFRPLMQFTNELGFGSTNVTSRGRSLYAVSLAKASSSTQRCLVQTALARDQLTRFDPVAVQAAVTLEQTAYAEFLSGALPEDVQLFNTTMAQSNDLAHDRYMVQVLSVRPGNSLSAAGLSPAEWYKVASTEIDLMRKVELGMTNRIVADAQEIKADAERDALINGAAALLAVAIAALLTITISRSMVRGMAILRASAIDVAENRLPSLVESLSKTDPDRVDTRVKPIPLFGKDEIGEVARAFDHVHREAVRLAAEQALLRGNVNAIFTNLSRRNQGLIQRQLALITDLENNETDPEQLENLFKLDHLATRMRRNGENLLVLAGEEPGRRWTEPVPLVDILRAAASEVEQYERIELFGIPETDIHGAAVNDLVHLLAELLENATSFSSPQTKVRVNGTRLPDGRVMIEIHDQGIGLTPEDFADLNHKLAHPPTVDVSVARRMGLFVVGRLAQRHGIRVQLRPSSESAGTTSLVMLPESITHGGSAPEPPREDFQVSRIVPEQQVPTGYGNRTAAELGFDDSRYQPVDPSILDPVGRSLKRQERRAALEAAANEAAGGTGSDTAFDSGSTPAFLDDDYATPGRFTGTGYDTNGANGYANGNGYRQEEYGQEEPHYNGYSDGSGYPAEGYGTDTSYPAEGSDAAAYGDSDSTQEMPYPQGTGYGQEGGSGQEPSYDATGQYTADTGYGTDARTPETAQDASDGRQEYDSRPYDEPSGTAFDDRQSYTAPGGPEKDTFGDFAAPASSSSGSSEPAKNGFGGGLYSTPPASRTAGFTESGLPKRQPQRQQTGPETSSAAAPAQNTGDATDVANNEWRLANDDTWRRASQVRKPQAGGVTPSGLPRRVPKANLVPGAARQSPLGGPSVSRAPDAIRGRLTNLRRGIQRGRAVGAETNRQGFGPNEQER